MLKIKHNILLRLYFFLQLKISNSLYSFIILMSCLYYFKWSGKKIEHLMLGVTSQNQNGPKHEKDISKVPIDFSFLTIQSNPNKLYQVSTSRIIIINPLNVLPK